MRKLITYSRKTMLRRVAVIVAASALAVGVNQARAAITESVSFSGAGVPVNQYFNGLSYEKSKMTTIGFFSPTNTAAINLFSMMGPAVLRLGGGTVDTTIWGGISNTYPITASEVDDLAGFMKALPNWKVIYGINLLHNTPNNCEAEAAYVANDLGSQLLGFEIGNEPELQFSSYSVFLARWRPLSSAVTTTVPGWDHGTGSGGWIMDGADAGQGNYQIYTDPFAKDEAGTISLLTQHYYRASWSTNDTMAMLMQPDPFLATLTSDISLAAYEYGVPLGARMTECNTFASGGVLGVSDAYGAALWTLDFMFTVALNGGQGVNLHGGGRSPYTPLYDTGTTIEQVRPVFYGQEMFSLIPPGNAVPATISPTPSINFTAYGVKCSSGGTSALLNNKDVNNTVAATVNLGANVASAILFELTGPSLSSTNGYTLGGAAIEADGTWGGDGQAILPAPNGQLTVSVPPHSAYLLNPVTIGVKPVAVSPGPFWDLRATLTTGPADVIYHYGGSGDTHFVMGDWDGNGTMTPGIVRTNSAGQWEWLLKNSNSGGGPDYDFVYGRAQPGDILVVGDWDGNGSWTPGIVRTNSSGQLEWLLSNSLSGGGANYDFVYGLAGDIPVVGDWDGNGTFTPGVVRGNMWYLRNENSSGGNDISAFGYGNGTTDMPIVGDWDGNGTWTPGVIHNGNTWELRNENSSGGADIVFGYGAAGDTFLVWK